MSILRLQSLVVFSHSRNSTWGFLDVAIWSAIEACVSIICACLPHIRLLLVRLFPVLTSSSKGGSYYQHSRTGLSRATHERRHGNSTQITASNKHLDEEGGGAGRSNGGRGPGISFQKTVTVEVDTDEVSLVSMNLSTSMERKLDR